jgi:2-polyprenyl-6-methoxyphenol hydroxylase-like FAD-dependent oxidoreductase
MRRAIVIGGSVGGLSAARALEGFFDEVVVIDRDSFPTTVKARSGVPQSRHAHVLLERGARELETLFPGFIAKMSAAGALTFDPGVGLAVRRVYGWQPLGPNGWDMLWASRDLLEFTLRKLLREQTRVRLVEQTRVVGLRYEGSPAHRKVIGVKLQGEHASATELAAELVVDASGRHSHAEDWLREIGLTPPVRDKVDLHAGYASRLYQAPAEKPADWWWKGLWIEWQPPGLPRAGVICPIEGDRWMVTLVGIEDQIPPTDERGYLAFMRTLSSPLLADAVARATPLSDIAGNRAMANLYRRYDRWRVRLPGFVAVADAVCAFNPIYGQGMSVAATCAGLLRDQLQESGPQDPRFAERFFARQARFVRTPWRLATGADFLWPNTEGKRPPSVPLIEAYMKLAFEAGHCDPEARLHLAPVFGLTGSLTRFFEPAFVSSVLLAASRRRLQARLFGESYVPEAPPVPG